MKKNLVEDTMWAFLSMGCQKGDPERLNEYVQDFIHMAKQKTGGQKKYAKRGDVPFDYVDPIKWSIICEAVALCLDERFPKIIELFKENNND